MGERVTVEAGTLQAIADAIRETAGTSARFLPSEMAEAILALRGTGAPWDVGDIPDYVKAEAFAAARKILAAQTAKSFTVLIWSDAHHAGEQESGWQTQTNLGSLHAAMGAAILAQICSIDLAASCGDYTFGNGDTTPELYRQQCAELTRYTDYAWSGIPALFCVGNHDTGEYHLRDNAQGRLYGRTAIYETIGKKNQAAGAESPSDIWDYCCLDFTTKKVRVIALDTVEGEIAEGCAGGQCSEAQLLWFAQKLREVGGRSGWSVIVLGHYPLDYGGTYPAGNVLYEYVTGGSVTIGDETVSFSGHNAAKFAAQFHGHTHCLKAAKLNRIANGSGTEFGAWRLASPSGIYYRNNDYAGISVNGIDFGEAQTYAKSAGSGKDTAFVVNVYDPEAGLITSVCYGAGYDRAVSVGSTVYRSVRYALTRAESSSAVSAVANGGAFACEITPQSGCTLGSVTVTMGGVDISQSAVDGGSVSIAAVSGDVVITAEAVKNYNYTNVVDDGEDADGQSAPYEDGKSLSSSGAPAEYSGYTLTGFIPLENGDVKHIYRIGGTGISWAAADDYNRIAWYDANHALLKTVIAADKLDLSQYFPATVEDESLACVAFRVTDGSDNVVGNVPSSAAYFRLAAKGQGVNLVVTLDEEIDEL